MPGARVELGGWHRCDEFGDLFVRELQEGTCKAWLDEPGMLGAEVEFEVREGRMAEVTLKEPAGGLIEVEVVDDLDQPLPFPLLTFGGGPGTAFLDLQDGVQRLDSYADQTGHRRFTCVRPGSLSVSATWASRRAETEIHVEPGRLTSVRLVLPRPADPEPDQEPTAAPNAH